MVTAKTPSGQDLASIADSSVHLRVLHDIMDVGRCARLGWPSLHRCWRSHWFPGPCQGCTRETPVLLRPQPPFSFSTPSCKLFSLPCRLCTPSSSLVDSAYVATIRKQSSSLSFCQFIRSDIYIVHHFVVFPICLRKKAFRASISLRGHCDACTWWLSRWAMWW